MHQIFHEYHEIQSATNADDCITSLKVLDESINITFASGRGKRETGLHQNIETLESYIIRKNKYQGYNETFKNRNSFSKTGPAVLVL